MDINKTFFSGFIKEGQTFKLFGHSKYKIYKIPYWLLRQLISLLFSFRIKLLINFVYGYVQNKSNNFENYFKEKNF